MHGNTQEGLVRRAASSWLKRGAQRRRGSSVARSVIVARSHIESDSQRLIRGKQRRRGSRLSHLAIAILVWRCILDWFATAV